MAETSTSSSNLRRLSEEEPPSPPVGVRTLLTPTPSITPQAWHEEVAKYLAVGLDHTSIARMVNCAPKQIGKLLGQGWFQEKVLAAIESAGTSPFVLFKGALVTAFGALVEIAADSKAQPSARVAAARELLNRFAPMGEAALPPTPKPITDPVGEYERLSAQLSAIRASEGARVQPLSASSDDI